MKTFCYFYFAILVFASFHKELVTSILDERPSAIECLCRSNLIDQYMNREASWFYPTIYSLVFFRLKFRSEKLIKSSPSPHMSNCF